MQHVKACTEVQCRWEAAREQHKLTSMCSAACGALTWDRRMVVRTDVTGVCVLTSENALRSATAAAAASNDCIAAVAASAFRWACTASKHLSR